MYSCPLVMFPGRVRYAQGAYYLQDQGSTLGTLLNGRPIQATVLKNGDQITIGNTRFIFHLDQIASRDVRIIPQPHSQIQPANHSRPYQQQEDAIARGAARAIAMNKSFTGKAWLTWALYYVGLFLVGLVFNIVYLNEANKVQEVTGQAPPGKGCLVYLLVVQLIGLAILAIAYLATAGAILNFF